MSLKLRWHDRAAGDLKSIYNHLALEYGQATAKRVRAEVRGSARRLTRHPFLLGRRSANPQIRILSLTQYPYRVYYAVTAVAVIILHVRHTARQAPDLDDLQS